MPKLSPEMANARREEIIATCETLYETMEFKNLTLKGIAKYTSLSRPSIYHLLARRPLPQFISSTVDRSELRSLRVNREGMNCLRMYLPYL